MSFINLLRIRSGSISQSEIYNVKIVEDTSLLSQVVTNMKKQNSTLPSDFNVTFKEGYYYNIRHIVDTNTNADIQYVLPDGFIGSIYFSSIIMFNLFYFSQFYIHLHLICLILLIYREQKKNNKMRKKILMLYTP